MRYPSFYPMISFAAAISLGVAAKAAEPEDMCGKMAGTEKAACTS